MALTERTEHVVTVRADGQLEVRQERVIESDGVEQTRLFHRFVAEPDQDETRFEIPRLREIATALWTPRVKEDYIIAKAARLRAANEALSVNQDTVHKL